METMVGEAALGWQAWFTGLVVLGMIVVLVREMARPDVALLGTLALLLVSGVVSPEVAFSGFSSSAVITIAALFIVAAGIQRTDALSFVDRFLFFRSGAGLPAMLLRMMTVTAGISAVVNNTPLVAMLVPRLQAWADREGVPASKLMIPLSYAAVLGGIITLIGTSTNLVVSGVLEETTGEGLGMFDLTWVGLPVAVAGIAYFALVGYRSLPSNRPAAAYVEAALDYRFEIRVSAGSPVAGKTVEEAQLRALQHAFLTHVRRGEHVVAPIGPQEVLQAGDVLAFSGSTDVMDRLLERPGLEPSVDGYANDEQYRLPLFEAVLADTSSLVGRTLKESDFRNRFQGVVLAIQRRNEEIVDALGSIRLKAGDLLVIEARDSFHKRWKSNREEFYLVAPLRASAEPPRREKAPIALGLFLAMVVLSALDVVPLVTAAFAAALAIIVTQCLRVAEAREEVDFPVLMMIAAAIGIGAAIEETGLASAMGNGITDLTAGTDPLIALAVIYVATNLLTELLTNSAAAALVAPIAITAAANIGVSPVPFAVAVAVAASAGFATPFGYQTHLMVMGAGGYRFRDFIRAGVPLNLIVMVVALLAIWLVWF